MEQIHIRQIIYLSGIVNDEDLSEPGVARRIIAYDPSNDVVVPSISSR